MEDEEASVVDWSQLPRELLDLISQHLPSESDLILFRSVCSTWRTSLSSPPKSILSFPSRFPILPNQGISDTCWGFHLSKRTIFRLHCPNTRPGSEPESRPDPLPGSIPGVRNDTRPGDMSPTRPDSIIELERNAQTRPGSESESRPYPPPGPIPGVQPGIRPGDPTPTRPDSIIELERNAHTRPGSESESRPDPHPGPIPGIQPCIRPGDPTPTRPGPNTESRPGPPPDSMPGVGPGTGPGDRTSTRPDWIIKLERDNPTRMHLLSPLSRTIFKPLPEDFPRMFDFSRFGVWELAQEYTLQYINYRPLANSIGDAGNLYLEKVALCLEEDGSCFVLLTIHLSGKLVMYKSGDKKWTVIEDFPSPYDDVICKGGMFYAVDSTGRAVSVELNPGPTPFVSLVAESVHGGDKKYLVESCGDLLLVDMYLSGGGPEDDFGYNEGFQFYEDFDCYMSERTVKFKVFKLNKGMSRWEEMASLGDRIVFLGDNSAFSALASEINSNCKGNCIFFSDQFYCGKEEEADESGGFWKSRGIGVFDVETSSILPIGDYLGYSDMFWPPPDWIYSTASIEEKLGELKI